MSQSKCPHCGLVNPPDVTTCVRCGADLAAQAVKEPEKIEQSRLSRRVSRAQLALVGIIFALAVGAIAYHSLVMGHLEQTAALFIGLPALLAIVLALTPKAKSATGMVMKGMTIALLMSGPLLGEGFICIIMAAPIFYLVGLIVGLIFDYNRRKREEEGGYSRRTFGIMLVPLLLLSLEGVHDKFSFAREETVTAERIVMATPTEVEEALSHRPEFNKTLPLYLRMGFPRPVSTEGEGLHPGDRRTIHFAGGEGHPGDLMMEVVDAEPGHVRFRALSDSSHVSHWLDWREAYVSWTQVDASHTKVIWRLSYTRRLDPAWYFGPWERYATGRAAGYLIDTLATPAQK